VLGGHIRNPFRYYVAARAARVERVAANSEMRGPSSDVEGTCADATCSGRGVTTPAATICRMLNFV